MLRHCRVRVNCQLPRYAPVRAFKREVMSLDMEKTRIPSYEEVRSEMRKRCRVLLKLVAGYAGVIRRMEYLIRPERDYLG